MNAFNCEKCKQFHDPWRDCPTASSSAAEAAEAAWEVYKEANPPKGQAQFYYKDNREYWLAGFDAGHAHAVREAEALVEALEAMVKYGANDVTIVTGETALRKWREGGG